MPERRIYIDVAIFIASLAAGYYGLTTALNSLSDDKSTRALRQKGKQMLKQLGREDLELDEHETQLASEIIDPSSLTTTFADIGGLDSMITNLRETIIYPLVYPELFHHSNTLGGSPKGVLLYGPPGCGKTMVAKALAKESGASFINVKISNIANKWFGESNKLVASVFSLARKLQPSIVFIDEIDAFLRVRSSMDHEATAMMKAEFMTLWDGLLSGQDRIIVLGATNRPEDIDPAIIRRMPKRFAVPMPDLNARLAILKIMLSPLNLEPSFPFQTLAFRTVGLSGSDLKELCRNAAMVPVRELLNSQPPGQVDFVKLREQGTINVRPMKLDDFDVRETEILELAGGEGDQNGHADVNGINGSGMGLD